MNWWPIGWIARLVEKWCSCRHLGFKSVLLLFTAMIRSKRFKLLKVLAFNPPRNEYFIETYENREQKNIFRTWGKNSGVISQRVKSESRISKVQENHNMRRAGGGLILAQNTLCQVSDLVSETCLLTFTFMRCIQHPRALLFSKLYCIHSSLIPLSLI